MNQNELKEFLLSIGKGDNDVVHEDVHKKRIRKCKQCNFCAVSINPLNPILKCMIHGYVIGTETALISSSCPLDKWKK